jgi:hypothetical protein
MRTTEKRYVALSDVWRLVVHWSDDKWALTIARRRGGQIEHASAGYSSYRLAQKRGEEWVSDKEGLPEG